MTFLNLILHPPCDVSLSLARRSIAYAISHFLFSGTGSKESITIQADQNRLSRDEIDEMLKRAEQFADEDKKQKELVSFVFVECHWFPPGALD